jgi:gliding motility-associated-like protein
MGIGSVKLSVWNRWGLPVYEDENYQNNWEGTYGGEPLPSGTYWYGIDFIKPDDGRRIKLANYLLIIK